MINKEVKDPLGFGVLDSPATDKIYTNTVTVRGWYLDKAGVESIKVYVNNTLIGSAIYGENREDVHTAYPNFNNHNAGFYYNLELPKENKNYTLKVVIRNKKGEETIFIKSFVQIVLQPKGEINYPLENGTVAYYNNAKTNDMVITGWHLELVEMKKVEIYINDLLQIPVTTSLNQLRNDIFTLYPEYSNKNSGYSVRIQTPNPGINFSKFRLKIVIENKNGQKTEYNRIFNVQRSGRIIITDPLPES
ncbi:hypothetical protein YSY43_22810 [Paenibacillus sp. YSY-4.3]